MMVYTIRWRSHSYLDFQLPSVPFLLFCLIWFHALSLHRDGATVTALTFTKLKFRDFLRVKARPSQCFEHKSRQTSPFYVTCRFYFEFSLVKQHCLISYFNCKSCDDLQYWSLLHPGLSSILYTQSLTHNNACCTQKKCSFVKQHTKPEALL